MSSQIKKLVEENAKLVMQNAEAQFKINKLEHVIFDQTNRRPNIHEIAKSIAQGDASDNRGWFRKGFDSAAKKYYKLAKAVYEEGKKYEQTQ